MSSALIPLVRTRRPVAPGVARAVATAGIVLGGAAFVALCSQITFNVPWTPVPYTLQTFSVLVVGGAMGSTLGVSSLALYLVAGLLGLGVFADGGSGWSALSSASGGYLIGFVVASLVVGVAADRGRLTSVTSSLGAFLTAQVIIFGFGLVWLRHQLGVDTATAFEYGLSPFIPGEILKMYAAGLLIPIAGRWVGRTRTET